MSRTTNKRPGKAKSGLSRKQKVAIYIRVSTLYQVDRDSLPMQRKDLIAYASLILGIEEYEIFEDAGYSGKNTDRPAFQEMMQRIRKGNDVANESWCLYAPACLEDRPYLQKSSGLCGNVRGIAGTPGYFCQQERTV